MLLQCIELGIPVGPRSHASPQGAMRSARQPSVPGKSGTQGIEIPLTRIPGAESNDVLCNYIVQPRLRMLGFPILVYANENKRVHVPESYILWP